MLFFGEEVCWVFLVVFVGFLGCFGVVVFLVFVFVCLFFVVVVFCCCCCLFVFFVCFFLGGVSVTLFMWQVYINIFSSTISICKCFFQLEKIDTTQ